MLTSFNDPREISPIHLVFGTWDESKLESNHVARMYRLVPLVFAFAVAGSYSFVMAFSNAMKGRGGDGHELVGMCIMIVWLTVPRMLVEGRRRLKREEFPVSSGMLVELISLLIYVGVFHYFNFNFQEEVFRLLVFAVFWFFVGGVGVSFLSSHKSETR